MYAVRMPSVGAMRRSVTTLRHLSVAFPIAGIVVSAAVPLVRYGVMQRDEQVAIAMLDRVRELQTASRHHAGGYAADTVSLTAPCDAGTPALSDDSLRLLSEAGYELLVRRAAEATVVGRDCRGREIVSDYYVAAAPTAASAAARQAFAGRSGGSLYLLVDGIAPREQEIDSGLAIPLEARKTFRIP